MVQLIYYSRTGITQRIADSFNGIPIHDYEGGKYILMLPSYGVPRTGDHVPKPVKKFLSQHSDNIVGVVGVGNRLFGSEFCLGAQKVADKFEVPLLTKIDLVPSYSDLNIIINAITSEEINV